MRRYLFSTLLFVLPFSAQAQNYIPSHGYQGAGVVVNMDVLNEGSASSNNMGNNMPIMSNDLPPPPIMSSSMAPPPVMMHPPTGNRTRQALGSMHDDVASLPPAPQMRSSSSDEMTSVMPPALPSPVMGNSDAIQGQNQMSATSNNNNFEAYRLFFDPSSDVLKPSETAVLNKITTKLNADPSLRLQVRAYANGTPDNAGAARRLSLTRALKVRDYLTEKNIASTRLDIRALGNGSAEMGDQAGSNAPPDRVDVVFSK
jgi:outer membrane protein OmpA-like peptidoglycan-associated protein